MGPCSLGNLTSVSPNGPLALGDLQARSFRAEKLTKARSGNQVRPENVGVNDDGAADWLSRHACSAARNSAPSSGVRSSITISACEGKGLALASNTSTGSSRLPSPEGWGCGFDISRRSVDERRRASPPTRIPLNLVQERTERD